MRSRRNGSSSKATARYWATRFEVEAAGKSLPAGFIGDPMDIGRLAVFLASDASRYIIGQAIVCDGGQTAVLL
jgi:NAD(P)-dependent dehydrogenase (short-subunit alcohol dehydrogenase family)